MKMNAKTKNLDNYYKFQLKSKPSKTAANSLTLYKYEMAKTIDFDNYGATGPVINQKVFHNLYQLSTSKLTKVITSI